MSLLSKRLAKLRITAFRDRELQVRLGSIAADHNPENLTLGYAANYSSARFLNSDRAEGQFHGYQPTSLALELRFLDSPNEPGATVDQKLFQLRALCGVLDKLTHEPRFLKVSWGKLSWNSLGYFVGRLSHLNVQYSLFDRDGVPLRATATLDLMADEGTVSSADGALSGMGQAMRGADHLTTSALANANSESKYLELARANDLDHADGLLPTRELTIPKAWKAL